jgi:hypothetical protein
MVSDTDLTRIRSLHPPRRQAIRTILTLRVGIRHRLRMQTIPNLQNYRLHPIRIPLIRKDRDGKEETLPEPLGILPGIGVNEIARVGDGKALLAEEPLVDFHLALVGGFPLVLQGDLAVLAGGLVIHDDQLAARTHPEVVDGAEEGETRGGVCDADALEVVAPLGQVGMGEGDGVNAVFFHEGMGLGLGAVGVEFFLEEVVDRRVQGVGRRGGAADAEAAVQVETAAAAGEVLQLAAAELVRLRRVGGEDVS